LFCCFCCLFWLVTLSPSFGISFEVINICLAFQKKNIIVAMMRLICLLH
jgi:hypothetical protein